MPWSTPLLPGPHPRLALIVDGEADHRPTTSRLAQPQLPGQNTELSNGSGLSRSTFGVNGTPTRRIVRPAPNAFGDLVLRSATRRTECTALRVLDQMQNTREEVIVAPWAADTFYPAALLVGDMVRARSATGTDQP